LDWAAAPHDACLETPGEIVGRNPSTTGGSRSDPVGDFCSDAEVAADDTGEGPYGMIARVTMEASDGPLGIDLVEFRALPWDGSGGKAGATSPPSSPPSRRPATADCPNVGDNRLRVEGRNIRC
jgi:hypothetical protein